MDDFNFDPILATFPSQAKKLENIHISLSKPCSLLKHEIELVKTRIEKNVIGIKPFSVRLDGEHPFVLQSESNDVFGVIPVQSGKMQLNMLVDEIDDALAVFGKEKYYSERILHASIASWQQDEAIVGEIHPGTQHDSSSLPSFQVKSIVLRSGHLQFTIPLG